MKHKKRIYGTIFIFVIITSLAAWIFLRQHSSVYFCSLSPLNSTDCQNPGLQHARNSMHLTANSFNATGTGGYECSRPVNLSSNTINKKGEYVDYQPVNTAEGNLFCQLTLAEDHKGKIEILQKPEVIKLIAKYAYQDVSVKALEIKYIEDKDYIHRLLPDYNNKQVGSIILLSTPGEDKVYLEDEKFENIVEIDYQTFIQNLEKVSSADRKMFYDNLK